MGAWRVAWARRRVARVALVGALLAALWWGGAAPGAALAARELFPDVAPHTLAHLLADFSLQPNVGSWAVLEDGGNYSTWRYAVRYDCGARCAGRAAVSAASHHGDGREPRHGRATRHRVTASLRACHRLPLLPWPAFCDEMQTEAVVSPGAGGAQLVTSWRTSCDVVRALSGACAARLRAHHDALLLRVRAALDEGAGRH